MFCTLFCNTNKYITHFRKYIFFICLLFGNTGRWHAVGLFFKNLFLTHFCVKGIFLLVTFPHCAYYGSMTFRNNRTLQRPPWQQVFLCGGKATPGWGNSVADREVHRAHFTGEHRDSSRLINADRLKSTLCQRINNKATKCLCMLLGKVTARRGGGETWGWAMSRRCQSGEKTPWLWFSHTLAFIYQSAADAAAHSGAETIWRRGFTWHSCHVSLSMSFQVMDTKAGVGFDSVNHASAHFSSTSHKNVILHEEISLRWKVTPGKKLTWSCC